MKVVRIVSLIVVGVAILWIQCIQAITHTVGDGLNWIEPPTATTYSIWSSTHVFVQGDFLGNDSCQSVRFVVFKFNKGIHNVAQVTKQAYKTCNTSSTISIHANSPVTIHLQKHGKKYFISTLDNDCQNGLHLAINVLSRLPPSPPPRLPPATSPAAAPRSGTSAPPPSNAAPPNDLIYTPPPSTNLAPKIFGHVSLFSIFWTVVFGLFSQFLV